MKISLNWIKDFVDLPENISPEKLGDLFTMKTAEVEEVKTQGEGLEGVVIGELIEIKKHPDADNLNLAKVNIGGEKPLSLIFGAVIDMKVGDKVPVAVAPTTLPTGMVIEKRKMRGEPSEGMLCLDQELGFKEEGMTIQYFPDVAPGTKLSKALNLTEIVFDIDNKSLTHRPDLWGHYGIAREFAALTNKPLKPLDSLLKFSYKEPAKKLDVAIKDKEISEQFSGCIITNVKIQKSPEWLQKRLLAVGIRPINNIVDLTNYVMVEIGQPMHAYDRKLVATDKIEIRFAKKGEKLETIDHKIRELDIKDPVVTNGKDIIGLAGIMGGATSEINDHTTEIILEAAHWQKSTVRKTSVRHGLRSEASQRFEKGLDPGLTEKAIARALAILEETCPEAKLETKVTTTGDFKPKFPKILLDPEVAASKIGIEISASEIQKILESLEFHVSKKGKDLEVEIPPHRATGDIEKEDDLIEEIARVHGYDEIVPELPKLPIRLPEENKERVSKHRLRKILSYGLGFTEVINYSFYSKEDFAKCGFKEEDHILLDNYLSEDQTHLRVSLAPNLLKSIQRNLRFFKEIKVYEIGRTYINLQKYFPLEEKKIIGAVVSQKGDVFHEAKGALEAILKKHNAPPLKIKKTTPLSYSHPVKQLTYTNRDGKEIARVFELHPATAHTFDIGNVKIGLFEINFTELVKLGHANKKYTSISRFPSIEIDISVVIDKEIEVQKATNVIKESDSELITNVELFDIYEGEHLEKEKKAIAFKVTLQAKDRTLTDEEMTKIQNQIFKNLQQIGGTIRGLK